MVDGMTASYRLHVAMDNAGYRQYGSLQGGIVGENGGVGSMIARLECSVGIDGPVHYCESSSFCMGGRNDTGSWEHVTCSQCLKLKAHRDGNVVKKAQERADEALARMKRRAN